MSSPVGRANSAPQITQMDLRGHFEAEETERKRKGTEGPQFKKKHPAK